MEARITVTADHAGDHLEVSVAPTTGAVMSQDDLDRVFDRFVRRDDRGSGTGLGLSIVKSLVDLQGGSIDVKSKLVDEGTTFTVLVPAEPPLGEPGGAPAGHPGEAGTGRRRRARRWAGPIAASLEPYGVQTGIATDGEEALAIERLREGGFDAITLDLMMEGDERPRRARASCAPTRSCAARPS